MSTPSRDSNYSNKPVFHTLILVLMAGAAMAQPQLGREISEEDWAPWDIDVGADGFGLPPGQGTTKEGAVVYQRECQACHGEKGRGGPNDKLVGREPGMRHRTIGNYWPYATTLFDYIRRAMPLTSPQSLSNDDVYAVSAYLLYLNDIIPAGTALDAQSLWKINMPNKDRFRSILEDE